MFFNAMLRKSQAIDQDQTLTFYAIDIIQGVPDVFQSRLLPGLYPRKPEINYTVGPELSTPHFVCYFAL